MARRTKQHRKPDPEFDQAQLRLQGGDFQLAASLYEKVLARRPNLADAHYGLGLSAPRLGDLRRGIEHLRQAVELEGARAIFHYALAAALRDAGDLEGAVESYTKAGWLDRTLVDCHADCAMALEQLNRLDEAEKTLGRALKADPTHERSRLIGSIVAMRSGKADAEDLAGRLADARAIAESTAAPLTRALAWQVVGDIADRVGDSAAAFAAFAACNDAERDLQQPIEGADREAYLASIGDLAGVVTTESTARWREACPADGLPAPAFLVGFPRSGTTMTERALDAHPCVRSLEERTTIEALKPEMAAMLGAEAARGSFASAMDRLSVDQVAQLRASYWRHARAALAEPAPADAVILDKLPIRTIDVPLINRLFPDARILFALRDPRDACLSCFRQRFQLNVPMSFFLDLADTGRLYGAVMGAYLGCRDAYTCPILEARYEDTVAEFEPSMRRIVEFLGLGWDPVVLSFHESRKVSRTPSYHTAREAVTTKAVGAPRAYADQLAPILPTLAPFIDAFGYAEERTAAG